jgi:hypothetical protein
MSGKVNLMSGLLCDRLIIRTGIPETFIKKDRRKNMDRRSFLKSAAIGTVAAGIAGNTFALKRYFPGKSE